MAQKMQTIEDLMVTGLTYVLDFERQVSEEAKKMAEASTDPEVKQVFEQSAIKGKEYAQRIQEVFQKVGKPVETNENHIAKAMIHEVEQMIAHTDASHVRDAALIVAANQMQMYRVAVYGSMAHYAELVGKSDAGKGLKQNLDDSKGGDEKLTRIGERNVNQKAAHAAA
jgi:ferritin-like metal-binding protein YciE